MSLHAVTCNSCGGAIAVEESVPRCLFCGSSALTVQAALPPSVEPPEAVLPFVTTEAEADAAFRRFARSSFWYPNDIRQARLELQRLMLPAWVWSGAIESHYAGLVSAMSRSGARPVAGSERLTLEGVLVPASSALTRAELDAISPFSEEGAEPFQPDTLDLPYELGELTRAAATQAATAAMQDRHRDQITRRIGAKKLNVSCLYADLSGRPMLLPVYIGAYRRGEGVYRIVINGQTGKLTGKAPISWLKVGIVIAAVLGAILMFFACLSILGAIGSQL